MPKTYTHFAFFFFFLTALTGVWMRLYSIFPTMSFPYDHILHAHSHVAILGWTFLGAIVIFLMIYWNKLTSKKEAKGLMLSLFFVTFIMFITFLYQSYGLYSIIMSTIHIFMEYWAVSFIYRTMKRIYNMPKSSKLFIKASLISLIISSFGPFALGFVSSIGLKETFWFDIAIYFYLHFQYNGWLFLFLIGVLIVIMDAKRIAIKESLLRIGFWIYIMALLPNYFASVLWVENHGSIVEWLAIIGTIGQWVAVICILLAFWNARQTLQIKQKIWMRILIGIVFFLLFSKSTMELGLMLPNLTSLVFDTRNVIIGYLHLTLLGFVSILIMVEFVLTSILPLNKYTKIGFIIFLLGFIINEFILFIQGLLTWTGLGSFPLASQGLLMASLLLLIGVVILWIAYSEGTDSYQ